MIEIKHVSKVYKTKKQTITAVDDVSLSIGKGEIYGIIGYSGAGKSTLLRMMNQLEPISSGSIFINNKDISNLNKKELSKIRSKIGMIFQHFNLLWSRTVIQNIELPLELVGIEKHKRKQRAQELIQLVGLEGKENAFPSELSGGQKQRVGIARALANHPDVLLCDEATSALDPETTESILDLLVKINKELNLTIILITHQMEVVQKICHKIAVMANGKIVEEGSVAKLFTHPTHPVTKRFVGEESLDYSEAQLKQIYKEGKLFKMTFNKENSRQAILSKVIRETTANISIVHAKLTHTLESSLGVMYIHSDDEFDKIEALLKQQCVHVEVI